MKKNNDILVLVDFSEKSYFTLQYAIALAKEVRGGIQLLHIVNLNQVLKRNTAVDVSEKESMSIEQREEKLIALIEMIASENITATSTCAKGDKITELEKYLKKHQPAIVAVGNSNGNSIGNVVDYLLNKYTKTVLLVGKETAFNTATKMMIASDKQTLDRVDLSIPINLNKLTKEPLAIFNCRKYGAFNHKIVVPTRWKSFFEVSRNVVFEYHQAAHVVKGIKQHVILSRIDLIAIGRSSKTSYILGKLFKPTSITNEIIKKLEIPILIMEKEVNYQKKV